MVKNKCILLGVTGSISAYKAANLASLLVKEGAEVHVLMTRNACNIINPITFETLTGNKCCVDTFDRNFEFKVEHVSLAKKADVFIIAPASANVIAKVANGIADDMLTTTFLASTCPKLIAPAMNTAMLENPITQDNIKKCASYGMTIIESAEGRLACGDSGRGKLPEAEKMLEYIEFALYSKNKDLSGKKVLLTAGPTQEAIDPVRFITNHSSGKMGYALAKEAAMRGAEVTLVSGPVNLEKPIGVDLIKVTNAAEMAEAVKVYAPQSDIIVKAAAVADYTPERVADQKIKKSDDSLMLHLCRTEDILAFLGKNKRNGQFICGFSMETENLIENSKAKLKKKNADLICANSIKTEGAGFAVDTNVITLISNSGVKELPLMSKGQAAACIFDEIVNLMEK